MAKLVDAPHSKCGGFGRASSSLALPITLKYATKKPDANRVKNNVTHEFLLGQLKTIKRG